MIETATLEKEKSGLAHRGCMVVEEWKTEKKNEKKESSVEEEMRDDSRLETPDTQTRAVQGKATGALKFSNKCTTPMIPAGTTERVNP